MEENDFLTATSKVFKHNNLCCNESAAIVKKLSWKGARAVYWVCFENKCYFITRKFESFPFRNNARLLYREKVIRAASSAVERASHERHASSSNLLLPSRWRIRNVWMRVVFIHYNTFYHFHHSTNAHIYSVSAFFRFVYDKFLSS